MHVLGPNVVLPLGHVVGCTDGQKPFLQQGMTRQEPRFAGVRVYDCTPYATAEACLPARQARAPRLAAPHA
jgi:hypothetical protein